MIAALRSGLGDRRGSVYTWSNNPKYPSCKEMKATLTSSPVISQKVQSKELTVLAVYTDKDESTGSNNSVKCRRIGYMVAIKMNTCVRIMCTTCATLHSIYWMPIRECCYRIVWTSEGLKKRSLSGELHALQSNQTLNQEPLVF